MKVGARTLTVIGRIVTGDEKLTRYRNGLNLVLLFYDYGFNDEYGQAFPSRWQFEESELRELNGNSALAGLLCEVIDPREFMDSEYDPEPTIEYINQSLKYDGYEIALEGGLAKVRNPKGAMALHGIRFRVQRSTHISSLTSILRSPTEKYKGKITTVQLPTHAL